MKIKKISKNDILFGVFVILFLIPQTRLQMRVGLNKLIAKISPVSKINKNEQLNITDLNLKLTGVNAPSANLNSMHGEIIFINFWATWCPPCIAEMPSMQKLYSTHQNNVNFLFITTDKTEKAAHFLKEHKYNFPVYTINIPLPEELDHTNIPTTLIIDKKGNIIVKKVGAADWNSKKINNLLADLN